MNNYRITVVNRVIYREYELLSDCEKALLGTSQGCNFRIPKELLFCPVVLKITRQNEKLFLSCEEGVYISRNSTVKLYLTELQHNDCLSIFYETGNELAFEFRFAVDFESEKNSFDEKIMLVPGRNCVISDNPKADICLKSRYCSGTSLCILNNGREHVLRQISAPYGVFLNGRELTETEVLKDFDYISVSDFSCFYHDNSLYTSTENLVINNLKHSSQRLGNGREEYPKFNRSTRLQFKQNTDEIPLLMPPAKPGKNEQKLLMSLLPALFMVVLVIVVRGFMSNTSNMSFVLFSVCSMSIGIVTSIVSYVENKKKFKISLKERVEKYTAYIEGKKKEVEEKRKTETQMLRTVFRSTENDLSKVLTFSSDIFDRSPSDEDFLQVYLGSGKRLSLQQIHYKKQESFETEDELAEIPEKITEQYRYLKDVPITMDFKNSNVVGFVGTSELTGECLRNITLDLASRHHYNDLGLYLLAGEGGEKYRWATYLPHFEAADGSRNIVYSKESRDRVFEQLYNELAYRSSMQKCEGLRFLVILVIDECGIKNHPLSRFMSCAASLNTVFVFFHESEDSIPQYCSELAELKPQKGTVFKTKTSGLRSEFAYTPVSEADMEKACRILSPVYSEEISLDGTLRKSISMFELMNICSAEDINLGENWSASKVYESMAAPIGVNTKDEIVCLDLNEKKHGPHGLVAGTTGSGKSEILQTYILSMATLFHPYEVGFVIIDFKGGGMVNQFRELPHLIGAITNIDGKEIDRSLKSIKAELLKRQELFARTNVNHIDKYIRLFKEGKAEIPLPHLIIIVDEFAELKAEQPEFMKELISAARIGRSLGVHLILATQKPAGQVNEQIWSNSRFKLCLKVQDASDSNEVIKSPLAAEIKEPGRAYFQVGNNELFELLQSGFSGAPELASADNEKEFSIYEVDFGGKRKTVFSRKKKISENKGRTQLDAIVQYVADFCKSRNIERLPAICLPQLPERVEIESTAADAGVSGIPIGIYDDPDRQYQGEAIINFADDNTLIIGAPGTGKTNLLQTVIRIITEKTTPDEAVFYIMDFGTMYLKNFETLKHVGGVVTVSDEEKLKNLFKLLISEINDRKTRFLELGMSSYSAYLEGGYRDYPRIFVFMNNYSSFKENYSDQYEDELLFLLREGVSCGISLIMTNAQTSGISFRMLPCFGTRVAFHCNDKAQYMNVFERCKTEPTDLPGRALFRMNKEIYEMQVFLAFRGQKEVDRSESIKAYISEKNQKYTSSARMIPEVPEFLTNDWIRKNEKKHSDVRYGVDYGTVESVGLDVYRTNEFYLVANEAGERMKALKSLLVSMTESFISEKMKIIMVDNFRREMAEFSQWNNVVKYTINYSECGGIFSDIADEYSGWYEKMMTGGIEQLAGCPVYIVIINSREAMEFISASRDIMDKYNKLITRYKMLGICFIYTEIEDAPVAYGAPELLKHYKDKRNGLILTKNAKEIRIYDVPAGAVRKMKSLKPGDAYLTGETDFRRIRLVEE